MAGDDGDEQQRYGRIRFSGRRFNAKVILWAVRWYLTFPISYCELKLMRRDHTDQRMKRLICFDLGFGGFRMARRMLAGHEVMAMIRKGQVRAVGSTDIKAQAAFIAALLQDAS